MCRQEDMIYSKVDSLQQFNASDVIDAGCRKQMVQWCYEVVDFCELSHNSVEIAMSYFDRFLSTSQGRCALNDKGIYQLACMTALYTAVKVHEPICLDPSLLSNLSQGLYSPEQFEAMEKCILSALQWRMNPPTTREFLRLYLDCIPLTNLSSDERDCLLKEASAQAELAVADSSMIATKASTIAFYALLVAMQTYGVFDNSKVKDIVHDLATTLFNTDIEIDNDVSNDNLIYETSSDLKDTFKNDDRIDAVKSMNRKIRSDQKLHFGSESPMQVIF